MIVDEVQSGFGRSGKMFAIEHSGVEPDIITVAKSMADGMPISGVVGTDTIMDSSGPNYLGGTYTGNPVTCAATLAVLEVIDEENILGRWLASGETLTRRVAQRQERPSHADHARHLGPLAPP